MKLGKCFFFTDIYEWLCSDVDVRSYLRKEETLRRNLSHLMVFYLTHITQEKEKQDFPPYPFINRLNLQTIFLRKLIAN